MYDLNLSVPNLTSPKYSNDNRFLLLKNYLYELNETLSYALGDKSAGEIEAVKEAIETEKNQEKQNIIRLNNDSKKRFEELKEQIIRTAEEIEMDYSTAISESEKEILQTAQGEFATKTELGEYKNQVDTELLQTAESISANAKITEELSADIEKYKKTNNAQLSIQAEEILSQVEKLYSSKTDLGNMEESISSQLSQTADGITEIFSEKLSVVSEDLSSVGGEVKELASSLDVYIRRGELEEGIYGIEIGRSDSNIKARFTNDRLSFFQGLSEVAYISGSNLYITRAEILDYLKIGNTTDGYFAFDVSHNGLEVMWSGGN
ncbi:MAG: hypothetical protein E7529_05695 [Ruminococcaceae bacterium]|nr:hypothetical protein [Oscillospiraceae bacterium]